MSTLNLMSYEELTQKVEKIELRREEIAKKFTKHFGKVGGISFYIFSHDLHREEETLSEEWKTLKFEIFRRNREKRALENI